MTSSGTPSPTPSAGKRQISCTKPMRCPPPANHGSKRRRRRHKESRAGPVPDYFGRDGPYRATGDRQRLLQATARQPRPHRDPRDQESWTCPSPSTAAGAKSPTPHLPSSNDSHSRPGADPTEPYAYAPPMAGHRDIGLGIRDDDRFLRRRSEFLSRNAAERHREAE
jgi:hypothetical protein